MECELGIYVGDTHRYLKVITEQNKSVEATFSDVFVCNKDNVEFGLAWENLIRAKSLGQYLQRPFTGKIVVSIMETIIKISQ